MKIMLTFVAGAIIFGLSLFAWFFLNALACAMNTTGCSNFSLQWGDVETLVYFLPFSAIGLALMAWAAMRWRRC